MFTPSCCRWINWIQGAHSSTVQQKLRGNIGPSETAKSLILVIRENEWLQIFVIPPHRKIQLRWKTIQARWNQYSRPSQNTMEFWMWDKKDFGNTKALYGFCTDWWSNAKTWRRKNNSVFQCQCTLQKCSTLSGYMDYCGSLKTSAFQLTCLASFGVS